MFCRNCGTKNDVTDKFCKNCGTKLENIKNIRESKFEQVAKKKNNPLFVILGVIAIVTILYFGRQIPEKIASKTTEKITFSGYRFEIPATCQVSVNNNILTIKEDSFQEQEAIGIRIYASGYDELALEMQKLANLNDTVFNLDIGTYKKEQYIIADYETGNYKGAVALKEAEDSNVFWIQTVSSSTTRGRKILNDFIPIIANAKKVGNTANNNSGDISVNIMSKLKEIIQGE